MPQCFWGGCVCCDPCVVTGLQMELDTITAFDTNQHDQKTCLVKYISKHRICHTSKNFIYKRRFTCVTTNSKEKQVTK